MTEASKSDVAAHTDEALMRQYGIARVPVERFHYKTYRYSTLADAVKQAQRDQRDA
jgi:hypothetical protein